MLNAFGFEIFGAAIALIVVASIEQSLGYGIAAVIFFLAAIVMLETDKRS